MENLGSLAVLLALCIAVYAVVGSVVGRLKHKPFLITSAERAVICVWALIALASGEVEIVIASAAAVNPQLKAGKVRVLAVSSAEPSPLLPGLPSIAQSGVPGYSYELWWGLFAPAGMPGDRINTVNALVNKILAGADMKKFLDNEGAEPWPLTPAQLIDLLPREIERYRKAANAAGISPQ